MPNPHKGITSKSLKPWIRQMTDDVPNCVCYTDYFLVLYVLVLYVLVYYPVFVIVIVC